MSTELVLCTRVQHTFLPNHHSFHHVCRSSCTCMFGWESKKRPEVNLKNHSSPFLQVKISCSWNSAYKLVCIPNTGNVCTTLPSELYGRKSSILTTELSISPVLHDPYLYLYQDGMSRAIAVIFIHEWRQTWDIKPTYWVYQIWKKKYGANIRMIG